MTNTPQDLNVKSGKIRIISIFIVLCLVLVGMIPGALFIYCFHSAGKWIFQIGLSLIFIGMMYIPIIIGKLFNKNRWLKLDSSPTRKRKLRSLYQTLICENCGATTPRMHSGRSWDQFWWCEWNCISCGCANIPKPVYDPRTYRLAVKIKKYPILVFLFCALGFSLGLAMSLNIIHDSLPYHSHINDLIIKIIGLFISSAYGLFLLWFCLTVCRGKWHSFCDRLLSRFTCEEL